MLYLFVILFLVGVALGASTGYAVTAWAARRAYDQRVKALIMARRTRVIW